MKQTVVKGWLEVCYVLYNNRIERVWLWCAFSGTALCILSLPYSNQISWKFQAIIIHCLFSSPFSHAQIANGRGITKRNSWAEPEYFEPRKRPLKDPPGSISRAPVLAAADAGASQSAPSQLLLSLLDLGSWRAISSCIDEAYAHCCKRSTKRRRKWLRSMSGSRGRGWC